VVDDDRGQATPLVAVLVLLVGLLGLGLGRLGSAAVVSARASTAADAAALAGAADGVDAARAVAAANGGRLVRFHLTRGGGEVEVTVRLGDATRVASARREGPPAGRARRAQSAPPAKVLQSAGSPDR
jgi:hypothetical protein